MSVSNGQLANQTTFNTAFVSRTVDTSTAGVLGLLNAAVASGSSVVNPQREVNGLCAFTGRSLASTATGTPDYANTNVIADSTSLKVAIEAIDATFNTSSGILAARAGRQTMSSAVSTVSVTFSATWPDTDYVISHVFENLTDTDPIFLQGVITSRLASGFTMRLNAETDSANYVMHWSIRKTS